MAENQGHDWKTDLTSLPRAEHTGVPQGIATFQGSFAQGTDDRVIATAVRSRWTVTVREGWLNSDVWKSAFIELVATMLLSYISGLIDGSIANTKQAPSAYVGITNIFLLSLFIMASAPSSGGHVNPTISLATMTAGLTSFSRGVLYIIGQTIGSAVAGGLLRGSLGKARTTGYNGGGCFLMSGEISSGQAFLIEAISTFALLFLAFGVGLDPRQSKLFGMHLGPLAVGSSLGLVSFASSNLVPGYTGASMNPARCFAFAIARSNFSDHWVWWVGPVAGVALQTIVYRAVPPYKSAPVLEA